jgi:hypothetical protein
LSCLTLAQAGAAFLVLVSQQADVMTLMAKSRSLIWMPIPFAGKLQRILFCELGSPTRMLTYVFRGSFAGVFVTMFCAAVNTPPVLIMGKHALLLRSGGDVAIYFRAASINLFFFLRLRLR